MSGAKSRSKGNRRELQVVHRFQDACIAARKVSRMYQPGHDIEVELDGGRLLSGEVKARADGSGFRQLNKWKGDNDLLFLAADRQPVLVVLDQDLFVKLLAGRWDA